LKGEWKGGSKKRLRPLPPCRSFPAPRKIEKKQEKGVCPKKKGGKKVTLLTPHCRVIKQMGRGHYKGIFEWGGGGVVTVKTAENTSHTRSIIWGITPGPKSAVGGEQKGARKRGTGK